MEAWGPAILRTAVGVVFVAHGLPKLLPVWGGPADTIALFQAIGLPVPFILATLVGAIEIVGGLALIAGAFTMWTALVLGIDTAVAIWKVHGRHGFFLNWSLEPGVGHGVEYSVVLLAALVCLALVGPGAFSFDGRRARAQELAALGRARLRSGKV